MPKALPLDPVAVFEHDFSPGSPLRSYPPVPAETIHQGEAMALRAFGSILKDIRSPRHPYFASWRDPDPKSGLDKERAEPPTAIIFVASFGEATYETSTSLVEMAEMHNRLDRAMLRLDLKRGEDGGFAVTSLTLEINDGASGTGRHFRSCWDGSELAARDISIQFHAPATRSDAFRFHVAGRLPRRYNHGAKIEEEMVSFTASGGAMPVPPWVNY
ncbi:hypothetical protein [Sphingomicrobium aestuariivivum]|uniref:hypothetical protein n=1 Tax=Sphingomicrobium aestuariivivum TaxID=1582356 RepID=UPI001FD662C4|nr:hypothetical protein [Sphingomicrobium aestuariivivum]MCJ8190535.1 hypothetical protein [Sphingomicrobium aestuariivivum]